MKIKLIALLVLLAQSHMVFSSEKKTKYSIKLDVLRIEVYTHRSYQLNLEKKFNPIMKSYFSEQTDKHKELHQQIKLLSSSDYQKDIYAPLHAASYTVYSEIDGEQVSIKIYKRAESEIEPAKEWIQASEELYREAYRVITEYANIE